MSRLSCLFSLGCRQPRALHASSPGQQETFEPFGGACMGTRNTHSIESTSSRCLRVSVVHWLGCFAACAPFSLMSRCLGCLIALARLQTAPSSPRQLSGLARSIRAIRRGIEGQRNTHSIESTSSRCLGVPVIQWLGCFVACVPSFFDGSVSWLRVCLPSLGCRQPRALHTSSPGRQELARRLGTSIWAARRGHGWGNGNNELESARLAI